MSKILSFLIAVVAVLLIFLFVFGQVYLAFGWLGVAVMVFLGLSFQVYGKQYYVVPNGKTRVALCILIPILACVVNQFKILIH